MTAFRYTSYAQEVTFGPGARAGLSDAIDRFRWQRVLLVTSGSARRSGRIAELESQLGGRLVAVYDHVQPHVQAAQVAEVLALAVESRAGAVAGLGGGSPIGMAKAVAAALEERQSGRPARAAFPTDQPLVPVIAIPTTYAGSEMTPVYGITHPQAGGSARKVTVTDPKIAPKLVIYDPELTLDLPPDVTAATGINAFAHCVEALYSITRHPLSTAAAAAGARHIARALPRCFAGASAEQALEDRTEMLLGAHLAGASLASAAMGLHHGLCHVLGGTAGVPHGVANAIILPHAMRFNADVTARELAPVAAALGVGATDPVAAVEAAAGEVAELVARMRLPGRLRDAGVSAADLPRLARIAFESRTVQNNPKPITAPEQIETLLRAAW